MNERKRGKKKEIQSYSSRTDKKRYINRKKIRRKERKDDKR